jgi:hypothetical protein
MVVAHYELPTFTNAFQVRILPGRRNVSARLLPWLLMRQSIELEFLYSIVMEWPTCVEQIL